MPNCAIKGCKTNSGNAKEKKLKLFTFPKNIFTREKWIRACKRDYKINESNARICSKHFTENAFDKPLIQKMLNYSPVNSRKLKQDAVPTEFLPPFAEIEVKIDELCKVIEDVPIQENPAEEPSNIESSNTIDKARMTYHTLTSTYEKLSTENENLRLKCKTLKTEFDRQQHLYEKTLIDNVKLKTKNRVLSNENQKFRRQLNKLKLQLALQNCCVMEDVVECKLGEDDTKSTTDS